MSDRESEPDGPKRLIEHLPVQGQGLALDLVATEFIRGGRRGRRVDSLGTPSDLDVWIATQDRDDAPALPRATDVDLLRVHELRGAIRAALESRFSASSDQPVAGVREVINIDANAARRTYWLGDDLSRVTITWTPDDPWTVALSQIARDALRILGDIHGYLQQCPAPACILYFWDETGRRRWCSTGCGTRVRVARHNAPS